MDIYLNFFLELGENVGSTSGRWNDLGGTSAGPRDGRKLGLVLSEGEGVFLEFFRPWTVGTEVPIYRPRIAWCHLKGHKAYP